MAGVRINATSGEVALVSNTAKTVLQVKAATNQRALIRGVKIMGKQPAGGTDPMVKCRVTRSSANFGAATSNSAVVGKNDPTDDETIQTTFTGNLTTEPTTPTDAGILWDFQPQAGILEYFPLDMPLVVPGGQAVNFEFTSPSGTPTVSCTVEVEE